MDFRKEAPTASARRLADREVKSEATSGEVEWLHDHPLLWYRALWRMREETNSHMFKAKTDLSELRAAMGFNGNPPPEYIQAKAAVDRLDRGRTHFKKRVEERMEQARSLAGAETVDRWMHGDLIMAFNDIGYAINSGDLTEARALVQMWIKRLSDKGHKHDQ